MTEDRSSAPFELWGGVECTVNRVHDSYYNQSDHNGHAGRLSDFDLFQALGLKALRHGILWESVAPNGLDRADWSWPDRSLARVQALKIRPIVGLVHHGSGPRDTSLVDPQFPAGLAKFAAAVAQRYPWVNDYTPVNEPLTTARFSGLYGLWYPHARDDFSFLRCLVIQCKAVVLAMRAVRAVNSEARLIQTEDLGKVFSTPGLAYQADFENQRRWLSFDLLCGRINRSHPMWEFGVWAGVNPGDLEWFLDNPSPPQVLGVNHYLSSDRFLDERIERYPSHVSGSNGRQEYTDLMAARILHRDAGNVSSLLLETWDRYKIPVAVTECHNGCTREEQMRWFLDVWRSAADASSHGADVLAVTAWSLLGGFNWNSLVTRDDGQYEAGVFDLRAPKPRPTAMAGLLKTLSKDEGGLHPVLSAPGWWKRTDRFVYGIALDGQGQMVKLPVKTQDPAHVRPLLITGGDGKLASAFARICDARAIPYRVLSRSDLDISVCQDLQRTINRLNPWAVVNTAACTPTLDSKDYDPAESHISGITNLVNECSATGTKLLTFSCSSVFDGTKPLPYVESDIPTPISDYSFRKVGEERVALEQAPSALIVRAGALFGPWDSQNVVTRLLQDLDAGRLCYAVDHSSTSFSYLPDLVNASLDLLIDDESGIWHLVNTGAMSWPRFLRRLAESLHIKTATLRTSDPANSGATPHSVYCALGSERGSLMPSLESSLERYAKDSCSEWTAALAA